MTTLLEDKLWSAIQAYFLCEAVGHVDGKCSRESFEKYLAPPLDALFYIATTFLPFVFLMFVINVEETLKRVKKFVKLHFTTKMTSTNLALSAKPMQKDELTDSSASGLSL